MPGIVPLNLMSYAFFLTLSCHGAGVQHCGIKIRLHNVHSVLNAKDVRKMKQAVSCLGWCLK